MFRVEATLLILSALPLLMALIFSYAVVPERQENLQKSMDATNRPVGTSVQSELNAELAIRGGLDRARETYRSLASYRLLIPSAILSILSWIGFSLGLSMILDGDVPCRTCGNFAGFQKQLLAEPAAAVLGAYLFNMGVLIRRAYVADITKNVMWASINRIIFSCGFAVFFHLAWRGVPGAEYTTVLGSFAVAFFPRLAITWLRRKATKFFGFDDNICSELNIQLIQGVDIWKEERLEEEGIESIQNMATADIFDLIPKLHFPVRTIVDWMDQAIFIQRFATCFQNDQGVPSRLRQLEQAGFRISAISAANLGKSAGTPDGAALIEQMAGVISVHSRVLNASLAQLKDDSVVAILDRIWQTETAEN